MPIPTLARLFAVPMDPVDRIEYQADLDSILELGESIASYTLEMGVEGVALGVTLGSGAYASSVIGGRAVKMWLEVDTLYQEDAAFMTGVLVPIEVTVITDNVPARRWQRTVVVRIEQQ